MPAPRTSQQQSRPGNRNNRTGFPHGGKLQPDDVRLIRRALKDRIFSIADIAHAFNLNKQTVSDIGS